MQFNMLETSRQGLRELITQNIKSCIITLHLLQIGMNIHFSLTIITDITLVEIIKLHTVTDILKDNKLHWRQ